MSDTALRENADRWDSGSSQASQRKSGVMGATHGERNKCSGKNTWRAEPNQRKANKGKQDLRKEHFALYVCVYLRFPLLVAYLMWLQM